MAFRPWPGPVHASWDSCCYGGYQPWWNIFAKKQLLLSSEEERLQRFWHDYYDALSRYYAALDHIDWVAYYKNHGYQINAALRRSGRLLPAHPVRSGICQPANAMGRAQRLHARSAGLRARWHGHDAAH